jgi:hypothetical protein
VRFLWSALKPATRLRKLRYYRKQGLTDRQIAARYNAGTLGKQSAARGHRHTPEHGLGDALRKPGKYSKYLKKQTPSGYRNAEDIAHELNQIRDKALASMRRLSNYIKYNDATVLANVFGGITPESGDVPGMDFAQATWTSQADTEEIRSMAGDQYRGNPWFYH